MRIDETQHISTNDARAGIRPHIVRYVLAISLTLVVAAFAAILLGWIQF